MRHWTWMAAGVVVLALTRPAQAQAPAWSWFGSGGTQQLQNVPVDPTMANTPIAIPVQRDLSFRLRDLLPKFGNPNRKPLFAQTIFPTYSQLPGKGYLQPFGFSRPNPAE